MEKKIDFIASVKGKDRCLNTVRHLLKEDVKFVEYDKVDFYSLKPYYDALKYTNSIICYGLQEIGEIFDLFNIKLNETNETLSIIE